MATLATISAEELAALVREEEEEGRYRDFVSSSNDHANAECARVLTEWHKKQVVGHYEYTNPIFSPAQKQRRGFRVVLASDKSRVVAKAYCKVIESAHGVFVQILPLQLVVPRAEIVMLRGSKLADAYDWKTYRYEDTDIYYAPVREEDNTLVNSNKDPNADANSDKIVYKGFTSQDLKNFFAPRSGGVNTLQKPEKSSYVSPSPPPPSTLATKGGGGRKAKDFPRGYYYIDMKSVLIIN